MVTTYEILTVVLAGKPATAADRVYALAAHTDHPCDRAVALSRWLASLECTTALHSDYQRAAVRLIEACSLFDTDARDVLRAAEERVSESSWEFGGWDDLSHAVKRVMSKAK